MIEKHPVRRNRSADESRLALPVQRIGSYTVEGTARFGGMGTVSTARHERTRVKVAIKLPRGQGEEATKRFSHEIVLLEQLSRGGYGGVPALLDSGTHEGRPYYVMSFVEGMTLRAFADQLWQADTTRRSADCGELSRPRAANGQLASVVALARGIAEVLSHIHSFGAVHCDLAPNNVVIESSGRPVIVDFGSAATAFSVDTRRELLRTPEGVHGTVGYVAPEQLLGQAVDARCDLYALGCILYELCTGITPFAGGSAQAIATQHLHDDPRRPSDIVSGLPAAVDALIMRMLRKDRRRRPAFAADIVDDPCLNNPNEQRSVTRGNRAHLYAADLIGRDNVLEALLQSGRDAASGRGGWSVVSGESGIGKTRLLAELGRKLGNQAWLQFHGSCAERSTDARTSAKGAPLEPFEPLLTALRGLAGGPDTTFIEQLRTPLAALAPYDVALGRLPGVDEVELPELPPSLSRRRVLRALRDCMIMLSRRTPLLLMLDDLHAADELTLEFLASDYIAELRAERILIVGTYRREQINDTLRAAVRANATRELSLVRLSPTEVRSVIKEMLAEEFPPNEFVEYVHQQSEGNPFYVAEYLRVALEVGSITRTEQAQWKFPEVNAIRHRAYANLPTPHSLSKLATIRLANATDAERTLLRLAAILGLQFDSRHLESILARVTPEAAPRMRQALHHLVQRQILASDGNTYRFAHGKLREAALVDVPVETAMTLHRVAAEFFERRPGADRGPTAPDAEIGMHWASANEPARAVVPLVAAARGAETRHVYEEAIDLYALALEQALAAASPDVADPAVISEILADLSCRTAKHDRARKHYAFAIERTSRMDVLAGARLWRKYAETYSRVHEHKQALQALDRAASLLEDTALEREKNQKVAQEWISLQQARLTIHYFTDPHGADTQRLIEDMLPTVERHGSPTQKSYFFQCVANERAGRQRYRFGTDLVDLERRALAELEGASPAPVLDLGAAQFDLAFMLLLGGPAECGEALPLLLEALHCAERFEDMTLLARALNYLSIVYRRLGDVELTECYARRTRQVAEVAQITPYLGAAAANLGWAAWRNDRLDEAMALLDEARSWWSRAEHVFPFQWLAHWPILELQVGSDDFSSARATLECLQAPLQQAMPGPIERAISAAAEACIDGAPRASERALRLTLTLARESGYV